MSTKKKTNKAQTAKPRKAEAKPCELESASHRVLTMADYRAMEKVAHALATMCRMRRKYVAAMQSATECIDRNLDKLREIVWNND